MKNKIKYILTIVCTCILGQVFSQNIILSGTSASTAKGTNIIATVGQTATEVKSGSGVKIYEGMYHYFGFTTPVLTVSGSISALTTSIGDPSATNTFSVSGTNLSSNITIKAPAGFEVSTSTSTGFANQITVNVTNKTLASTDINIRIASTSNSGDVNGGNVTVTSGSISKTLIVPKGTVNSLPSPIITLGKSSLVPFITTINKVSYAQIFTVTGTNLTSEIDVSAPTGYEISTNKTGPFVIVPIRFLLTSERDTIWVRIRSTSSPKDLDSTLITVKSGGAVTQIVTIPKGKVNGDPTISTNKNSFTNFPFNTTFGKLSEEQSFTVSGEYLTTFEITPTSSFEISKTSGGVFLPSISLTPDQLGQISETNIYIRLKKTTGVGSNSSGYVTISATGGDTTTTTTITDLVYNVTAVLIPTIITSTGTLKSFSVQQSLNSEVQNFTVEGVNLKDKVKVKVPASYEISEAENGNFLDSLTLAQSSGTLSKTTLYIRTKNSLPIGEILAGNVIFKSEGATNDTLSIPKGEVKEYLFLSWKTPSNVSTDKPDSVYVKLTANATTPTPTVTLRYKKITEDTWKSKILTVDANGKYASIINKDSLGEIGIEYYFDLTYQNSTDTSKTDLFATYKKYEANLQLPTLLAGKSVDAYQLISFPNNLDLSSKLVKDILSALGTQNSKTWRLFRYNADTKKNEEYPDFTEFENGRAYWLISKNGGTMPAYSGIPFNVTTSNPYKTELKKGWNLVGNPYNFNLSWSEIKASTFNNLTTAKFRNYNKAWDIEDKIKAFSGFFVWVDNLSTLTFPTLKNESLQTARLGSFNESARSAIEDDKNWQINFELSQGGLKNNFVGIGMNQVADSLFDKFDEVSTPRLNEYLEFNTKHTSYFHPTFSKDVIPSKDNKTWDFEFETSNVNDLVNLQWQEPNGLENDVYLIDPNNKKVINLKASNTYSFKPTTFNQSFKLVYGNKQFINDNVSFAKTDVISLAPNPTNNYVNLEYFVLNNADDLTANISIKNINGETVYTNTLLANIGLNTTNIKVSNLPSGLYILELIVANEVIVNKFIKN